MNILSNLRTLARRSFRRAAPAGRKAIRKPSLCRPCVEALEDRRVLSGIQMIALVDGTFQLRVDGDAKANQVTIVGQGPGDQIGDYSLHVRYDQLEQTVTNVSEVFVNTAGGADTVVLTGQWAFQGKGETMSGVRSILVNTGGDDDVVTLGNWTSGAGIIGPEVELSDVGVNLSVETGAGRDTFLMHDNDIIAGSFDASVDLGGGDDKATFEDSYFRGGLFLTLTGGSGDDLAFLVTNEIAAAADVSVDLGSGDDAATFMGNTFGGAAQLTVNGGAGKDRIEIGGDGYAGMMEGNLFGSSLALTITGGSGDDLVTIQCDGIAGLFDASVDLGTGDDTLTVEDNTFGGSLNLSATGGAGADEMFLEYNSVSGAASVTLELGQGDDKAILEDNYFLDVFHLQIGGGAGSDVIICEDDWLSGLTDYKIFLGDGDDRATFEGNIYDQGLNMFLDAGAGRDTVAFHGNSLAALPNPPCRCCGCDIEFLFNLGKGDDALTVNGNTFGAGLNLSVTGGDGRDTVAFHGNSLAAAPSISEIASSFTASVDLGSGVDSFLMTVGDVNVDPNNPNMGHVNGLELHLQGGSGADAFLIGLLNVAIDGELDITANGGDGVDTFTADLENVAFTDQIAPATAAHIRLNGDGGADTFSIAMLNINAPLGPAALHIDVTGDGGNDQVTAMFQDTGLDAHLNVNLGAGEDMFTANILPDTSTKPFGPTYPCIDIAIHGGSGADTFNLNVGQPNPARPEESLPHLASEVMAIFNGAGGADAFLINLLNVALDGSVEILEEGGDGADQFRTMIQNVELGAGAQFGVDSGIVADGGDGNDVFLTTFAQVNGGSVWKTDYKGGNGNDAFTVTFGNVRAPLLVTADLGLGNDSAVISIFDGITDDDNAPQSIGVNVNGGGGRDNLFLSFVGPSNGNLDVQLNGGDDNDIIDALFNLLGQSTGSLSAKVFGGKGNDTLGLHVFDADSLDQFFANLDGGEGVDKAKATPNVTVNNCEK